MPKGTQQVTPDSLVVPRLWVFPCTTPRKQQSLSEGYNGGLSGKKVLEVSRTIWNAVVLGQEQPAASPHPPHVSVLSQNDPGQWCMNPTWPVESRRGQSLGMHPEHLCRTQVPFLPQCASRCLAVGFLPDLGRCVEDMESPAPDPRMGLAQGAGRGGGDVLGVEEDTAFLLPDPGREDPAGCPADEGRARLSPQSSTGASERSGEPVRLEGEFDGQAGPLGPLWPTPSGLRTFAPAAASAWLCPWLPGCLTPSSFQISTECHHL